MAAVAKHDLYAIALGRTRHLVVATSPAEAVVLVLDAHPPIRTTGWTIVDTTLQVELVRRLAGAASAYVGEVAS